MQLGQSDQALYCFQRAGSALPLGALWEVAGIYRDCSRVDLAIDKYLAILAVVPNTML